MALTREQKIEKLQKLKTLRALKAQRGDLDVQPQQVPQGNIIEEQHEGVTAGQRLMAKNLADNAQEQAAYIQRENPDLEVQARGDRVLIRTPGERDFKVLDPDTGFLSTDFLSDVGDIGYDIASGIGETAATIGLGLATGGVGGVAAGAGTAAASEAVRQELGRRFGVSDEFNTGDVLLSGAIGGAIPAVAPAIGKAFKGAKGALRGGAKFLTGASDEVLDTLGSKAGQEQLERLEREGIQGRFEDAAGNIKSIVDEVDESLANAANAQKAALDFNDPDTLQSVVEAEISKLSKITDEAGLVKPEAQAGIVKLEQVLADIPSTQATREAVAAGTQTTAGDVSQFARKLSKDTKRLLGNMTDEARREIDFNNPAELKEFFEAEIRQIDSARLEGLPVDLNKVDVLEKAIKDIDATSGIRGAISEGIEDPNILREIARPGSLEADELVNAVPRMVKEEMDNAIEKIGRKYDELGDVNIPTFVINEEFEQAIEAASKGVPTEQRKQFKKLLKKEYKKKFQTRVDAQVADDSIGGVTATAVDRIKKGKKFISLPDEIPFRDFMNFKKTATSGANYDDALNAKIGKQAATSMQKFYRGLERKMSDAINVMSEGRTGELGQEFKTLINKQKELKKMFNTEASAKSTINRALKGDKGVLRKLEEFDELTGSTLGKDLRETVEGLDIAERGLSQSKIFKKGTALAEERGAKLAGVSKEKQTLIKKLDQKLGSDDAVDSFVNDLKSGKKNELMKELNNKFGDNITNKLNELVDVKKVADQKKIFDEATELATVEARKTTGITETKQAVADRLREKATDTDKLVTLVGEVKKGERRGFLSDVKKEFGGKVEEEVSDLSKMIDLVSAFADEGSVAGKQLFGSKGRSGAKFGDVAGRFSGALGWTTVGGAQAANLFTTIGQSIGNSKKVRNATKELIKASFAADRGIKKLTDAQKAVLEKQLMKRLSVGQAGRKVIQKKLEDNNR